MSCVIGQSITAFVCIICCLLHVICCGHIGTRCLSSIPRKRNDTAWQCDCLPIDHAQIWCVPPKEQDVRRLRKMRSCHVAVLVAGGISMCTKQPLFFSSREISANVYSKPVGMKMGSHPNMFSPLGSTIDPSHLPTITTGSWFLLWQKAYVH